MNADQAMYLDWDWVSEATDRASLVMANPLAVRSNLRLMGAEGPLDRIRAQLVLSRMVVSIPWQAEVAARVGL